LAFSELFGVKVLRWKYRRDIQDVEAALANCCKDNIGSRLDDAVFFCFTRSQREKRLKVLTRLRTELLLFLKLTEAA